MFGNIIPINEGMIMMWLALIALWTLPWKGVALWKSSRKGAKTWFIVLLVLNTVGILEILYIFIFSKQGEKKEPAVTPIATLPPDDK